MGEHVSPCDVPASAGNQSSEDPTAAVACRRPGDRHGAFANPGWLPRSANRRLGPAVLLCVLCVGSAVAAPHGKDAPHFEPARVVHATAPGYPFNSIAVGTVILKVEVASSGDIDHIDVVHSVPSLTEEVERTVRTWTFQPAKSNGESVASSITAAFAFSSSTYPSRTWRASAPSAPRSGFEPIQVAVAVGSAFPFRNNAVGPLPFGGVVLEVEIGQSGAIDRIKIIDGRAPLTDEAERTIRRWRFFPARLGNSAIKSTMVASFILRRIFTPAPPVS
jgi:TonB family protein